MGALDRLAGLLGYVKSSPAQPARGMRGVGFDAAQISRITSSLQAETEFINTTLRYQLRILRARSRQAAANNPFARHFVNMAVNNICGPQPFRLEAKIKSRGGKSDDRANEAIEAAWRAWGRAGACEITEKWSLNATLRLLTRILAVDGELLVRMLRGPEFGKHSFRLQIIDVDRLWEGKNESLKDGGAIHAGVEVDAQGRVLAYHLLKRKPSQWQSMGYATETERIPAGECLHVFVPEYAEQIRGVPWIYAALLNLVNLGAFEEAAVIAARIGAANMGIIESPDSGATLAAQTGAGPAGDGTSALGGANGDVQITAEPGAFWTLPAGYKMGQGWNPKYPDAAIGPFIDAMLRGISAGLDVAHHNLSANMEGVNYSSARIAELSERSMWMQLQNFFAEHLLQPVYEDWLRLQVINGQLPFDPARIDKYRTVHWQGRRWAWVDPLKEVGAQIEAIDAKIKSRTRIAAENGEDLDDTFEEIAEETAAAAALGIDLSPVKPRASGVVSSVTASGDGSAGNGDNTSGGNAGNEGKKRTRRWRDPRYTGDDE